MTTRKKPKEIRLCPLREKRKPGFVGSLFFAFSLIALLLCLSACTAPVPGKPSDESAAHASASSEPSAAPAVVTVRVVSADETGSLLLAGENEVYRNTVRDGQDYRPGMLLDITFDGSILETYPAQLCGIQSVRIREEDFDDRCALYMDVLEDLWNEDDALQADTQYVGLNLEQTSLTKCEQYAIAWRFGELHQKTPLTGTFESLCEDGYIDGDALYWEDGCLLTIAETEAAESSVTFRAEKWRSGLGAIFWTDCTASRGETGAWGDYTVGGYAIS